MSNFLNRDFFFDYEIPSSTPPDYASQAELKDKFTLLLESPRSLVSELVEIPNRRVTEIDRDVVDKVEYLNLYRHFMTTEELKKRFEGTVIGDSFAVGRICLTRESLNEHDLIEWTHTKLSHPSIFYFLPRPEKRELLASVEIKYFNSAELLAGRIDREIGPHHAIHCRQGDYFKNYGVDGYAIDNERFRTYVRGVFKDDSLPVLIATDGLQAKEMFANIFEGYRLIFVDELVFDDYLREYSEMEFTDFNALTIVNQLLCASATLFIGTYRSTFTSIIHRLRQERYGKTDFFFFPDERVARLLNGEQKITPDQHGFFDWNRYSAFAETHNSVAWMREWDYALSSIDV